MPVESHVSNLRHSDSVPSYTAARHPMTVTVGRCLMYVQCSLYAAPAENTSIRLHALYGNIPSSIQTLIIFQGHGEVTLGDMRCSQRCAVLQNSDSSGIIYSVNNPTYTVINIKNLATCFGSQNHHQAKYKTHYWYIQRVHTHCRSPYCLQIIMTLKIRFNPLNTELNPICQ